VPLEQATAFVDKVLNHYGPGRKFFFEFTGGEITLYKDFFKLAEYIKSKGCKLGIISNGSRALPFWEKARPLLDQICLSFHPESADPEHFLSVVQFMAGTVRTHVNIMMTPEKFDYCYGVAAKAKDIGNISMALQPLMKDFGDQLYGYSQSQRHILDRQTEIMLRHIRHTKEFEYYRGTMAMEDDSGRREEIPVQQLIASGQNNWRGWNCHIGLEQFVVGQDGSLMRGWCGVGGRIGSIKDPNLTLPTEPIRCTKSFCHCNFDIMSTKVRPRD
jgi:hypothetical protein